MTQDNAPGFTGDERGEDNATPADVPTPGSDAAARAPEDQGQGADAPTVAPANRGEHGVRQDWRARHLKAQAAENPRPETGPVTAHQHGAHASGTPASGSHRSDTHDGGPQDGGTLAGRAGHQAWAWTRELLTIVVIAIVLSFLVKTFLFRAFYIPSGSMENTLEINDRIFVNLLVPEPFSLKRGDVVVFKDTQGWLPPTADSGSSDNWLNEAATFIGLAPDDSQQHLVKRVIGLPGDHVMCCDAEGKVTINGTAITEPYLYPGASPSDTTFDVVVPEGMLWVMGDHRNNSDDSRYQNPGFVPIDDVEGRAVVIAWPLTRWSYLSNYSDVFADVPAPTSSTSVSSSANTSSGTSAGE